MLLLKKETRVRIKGEKKRNIPTEKEGNSELLNLSKFIN